MEARKVCDYACVNITATAGTNAFVSWWNEDSLVLSCHPWAVAHCTVRTDFTPRTRVPFPWLQTYVTLLHSPQLTHGVAHDRDFGRLHYTVSSSTFKADQHAAEFVPEPNPGSKCVSVYSATRSLHE